ncbi:cullin, conserved site-containing protein [Tanacetum coccineum]|uniref:Cullin, conserved site-containing protein n=1 Tax=Tanacetum coccineum TaxID=301880 RepID=A0ABQ5DXZ6_9ASTR
MTSVFVPGDLLVSPLNESLLCLTKVALPVNQFVDASSSRHEEVKQIEVKELNSVKCEVVDGIKNEAPFLEKCVGTLSFDNKRDLTNESKGKLSKAPAEAASHDNWVACDRCNAWRLLPIGITADNLPENWWCSKSTWLPGKNYCDVSEDETTQAVREMNFKISSQNHVIGDTYHANSNANSETLPDGWKKNKSRHEGSNSSQVETSHSSMDSRQKRKRLSEANQQLLEKNIVNKPIDVGRNAATVNGEPRPKKLKTMTGIDQHDHLTSTKIKNENERQTENTRASSKSKLLDRKSCEEVEMPAKKRKLKDQDTPPYANTVKEKRLKTSNTDINGEEKPLIKGNGMKIKLSVSREGSVDKSHEKLLNATSSRKDLESEQKTISRKSHAKSRPEVPRIDGSGVSNVIKRPKDTANQTKSLVKDCGTVKDLSVVSFLKEYASSQTAMTAFKKAEESKDYADRLKILTCRKLAEIWLKNMRNEIEWLLRHFAYKLPGCSVFEGESPSSSAFVVDNLNNQATIIDKTMLSKNITHLGNQVVARSQANFTRLLDFTSDVSLAMEASLSTQNAYKAASTTLEESQNKEMTISVKTGCRLAFKISQHKLFDLPFGARRFYRAPPYHAVSNLFYGFYSWLDLPFLLLLQVNKARALTLVLNPGAIKFTPVCDDKLIGKCLGKIVLEALILTSAVVTSLTAYTFWASKKGKDFSFLGPILFTSLVILLVTSFMQMVFPLGPTSNAIIGGFGAVIFSGYIIYDTENLIKRFTYDEYIWASVTLYLDILNLFLTILRMLNRGDN